MHYEDLIKKLSVLMAYPVIWKTYNHDMTQATVFAMRLFPDKNIEAGEYPAPILDTIAHLKPAGISDWGHLQLAFSKVDARLHFALLQNPQVSSTIGWEFNHENDHQLE